MQRDALSDHQNPCPRPNTGLMSDDVRYLRVLRAISSASSAILNMTMISSK